MVHGIEKFKEYFKDFLDYYVLIGGTACDILMNELGVPFRSTKDLDVVLIIESLDLAFGEAFWRFIEDGDYEHKEKDISGNQFYRFSKPKDETFPRMIELFGRKPVSSALKFDNGLTPIHIDESIASLSAILLNDDYYELLRNGKRVIHDLSLINIETLILFKIKAYLDWKSRIDSQNSMGHRNIRKHRNDVFRLLANVGPTRQVMITETIKNDVHLFIRLAIEDKPDLKDLRIRESSLTELMIILKDIYL